MSESIVFVIGAGASSEVGLPTGPILKTEISKQLNIKFDDFERRVVSGSQTIVKALNLHTGANSCAPYFDEARFISSEVPHEDSIDSFIAKHRGNDKLELCGKLAIVHSILKAERSSRLFKEQIIDKSEMDYNKLTETWYPAFFRALTSGCRREDLRERFGLVTLVIFNYDRCIEHFLYCKLQSIYRMPAEEAADLIDQIHIFHPYGVVGALPWQGSDNSAKYGMVPSPKSLLSLAGQIKTIHEAIDIESSELTNARFRIGWANRLAFLGFGFIRDNMELIGFSSLQGQMPGQPKSEVRCFATVYETSSFEREEIDRQIKNLYFDKNKKVNSRDVDVKMEPVECSKFFTEFKTGLTF